MSYRTLPVVTTRLSSKGQVVLPGSIRAARHWEPGLELKVEETRDGVLLTPVKAAAATRLADVVGSAGYRGPAKSLAQMQKAIAQGVKARRDRR
jgi:AbrB family looped-hinge helix DNA binding protein